MTPQAILAALARADLARLGFRDEDAAACRDLVASLPHNPEVLERVMRLAEQLVARIGRFFDDNLTVRDDAGLATFDEGLVTLLGLVAVADTVHDAQVTRGLPSDLVWAALSDLGQQVHVFRRVFGFFGFRAQTWCVANFTGRHLWLGRLQFSLERTDDGTPFVGIHIPECGPLTPEAVDESLSRAVEVVPLLLPGEPLPEFRMESWLLDPLIVKQLDPKSNMARFARRFTILEDGGHSPRSAYFFVFRKELSLQPVDFSALPAQSSLQRAILSIPLDQLTVPVGRLDLAQQVH